MVILSSSNDPTAFVSGTVNGTFSNTGLSVAGVVKVSDANVLVGSNLVGSPNIEQLALITASPVALTNVGMSVIGFSSQNDDDFRASINDGDIAFITTEIRAEGGNSIDKNVTVKSHVSQGGTVTLVISKENALTVTGYNPSVILKGPVTCEITLDNVPSSGNITLSLPANLTNIVFYTSSSSHPQYDANGKLILNDAVQFINVTWSNLVTGYAKVEFVFNATFTIGSISSPPVNGDNPVLSVDFNPSSLTVYPYPYYTSIVANVTATKNATTLGHGSIIFTSPILPNGNTFTADFFGTIVLAPSAIVPMLDYPPLNSCCPEIDEAFNNYTNAVICLFKSSHVFTSALKVAAFDVPLIIYDLVSCFKNVCDDDAVRKKIVKIIKRLALNVNDNASYLVSVNRSLSTLENICTNCVQCDGNNTNVPSKRLDDIEASLHKLLKATSANKSNVDELIQQLKRLKMKDRL